MNPYLLTWGTVAAIILIFAGLGCLTMGPADWPSQSRKLTSRNTLKRRSATP